MNKTAVLTNMFAGSCIASKVSSSEGVTCSFSPLLKLQSYSNPYVPETNADGSAGITLQI